MHSSTSLTSLASLYMWGKKTLNNHTLKIVAVNDFYYHQKTFTSKPLGFHLN